jgi:hypothetical protein
MAAQGQDPNNNRIDVSLNIISDAALQAVKNLTDQMSGLRELIASQGLSDPALSAQAAGRAAAYTQPGGVQAGIHHGPSQPILVGDPSNPSQGAQVSRQQREALRTEYQQYVNDMKAGIPPRGGQLSGDAEQMMMHNLSDIQRGLLALREKRNPAVPRVTSAVDRFFELYPGVSRDPMEDRTQEDVSQMPRMGGSALPEPAAPVIPRSGISTGASTPGGPAGGGAGGGPFIILGPDGRPISTVGGGGGNRPPNRPPAPPGPDDFGGNAPGGGPGQDQPGWAQALGREGITPESRLGLTIPRLGEFTVQDKLNMYAQWMGRAAMRRQDEGDDGRRTTVMGRTAAGAAYLRDQSAAIVAVNREFQRLRNFAQGQELGGEQLGFSRESALGDVELLGAGFRLNYGVASAAQREALHQEFTQRRVQAAAGVSGEEAQRIRQIVAGMGYSGGLNADLQLNLFRNLQQRGIAPEAVAPLVDQGVRQGNSSVAALRDTMYDLADAARNAHMTLEEVTSATAEYAESVQDIGANYEAALRNAATFTRMGIDPRIASQAQQSPMVQGILTARTGLPPQLQGIVAAPQVAQAMGQAIDMGLALGRPFSNMPDSTMTSASGQKITVATGRDAQIAMAQQMTGMPRQIIERYMRNPQFLQTGAVAQTMVGQMEDQVRAMTQREHTVQRRVDQSSEQRGQSQVAARFGNTYSTPEERRGAMVTEHTTEHVGLSDAQRRALERGSTRDQVVQYNELEQQMIAMDPNNEGWKARVRKISKDHGNVEDRIKVASRIIGEATATKPEPDYLVGLTDEARKILKIERPKDRNAAVPRANAGGAPANSSMQGPNFPSSSGSAYQYGKPGP